MRIRNLVFPGAATLAATLVGVGALAFAQEPAAPPDATTQRGTAEEAASTAQQQTEGQAPATEQPAEEPKGAAPRTAEQAAIAREIARNAPKRQWPEYASNPARDRTVMFPQKAKKVSDVSIIASVDQVNRLEALDITGGGASSDLRIPTASLAGPGDGAAEAGQAAGATEGAPAEGTDAASETPAESEDAPTVDSREEQASSPQN